MTTQFESSILACVESTDHLGAATRYNRAAVAWKKHLLDDSISAVDISENTHGARSTEPNEIEDIFRLVRRASEYFPLKTMIRRRISRLEVIRQQ
ncbi:MAG: hypothetical protein JXO72_03585 [Vicinamibacteria bacterium]|nr:hypothetical protein [Vicinamibacteria bacterium]